MGTCIHAKIQVQIQLHSSHWKELWSTFFVLKIQKCEQSTQGSEGTTSASFDVDIENFVRKQEKDGKPFFCEDPETDNLVSNVHALILLFVIEICSCSLPSGFLLIFPLTI